MSNAADRSNSNIPVDTLLNFCSFHSVIACVIAVWHPLFFRKPCCCLLKNWFSSKYFINCVDSTVNYKCKQLSWTHVVASQVFKLANVSYGPVVLAGTSCTHPCPGSPWKIFGWQRRHSGSHFTGMLLLPTIFLFPKYSQETSSAALPPVAALMLGHFRNKQMVWPWVN